MNGGGGGGGGSKRVPGIPWNGRKDRDEDLLLFRELHKREKDRMASLLQPVSEEFEPNAAGNHALYRIASGKKGSGYELFAENDKNDYDWLKTPPATPLFPSLEMEATAPELVIQREIPILQPLSRFAGNLEASKGSSGKPKSHIPNPKPKIPSRSITPSQRPSISSTETKNTKLVTPVINQKTAQLTTDLNNKRTNYAVTNTTKWGNQHLKDFLNSNLSKNMASGDSKTKPRSRGVSPSVRSTIPSQIPGFSNETPPNLRTDRSTSATRGRQGNPTLTVSHQKPEPTPNPRRQSCSPSVTRGRKMEPKQESTEGHLSSQKGRTQTQFLGSRMVDKVMNARKSGVEEREAKQPKSRGSTNESNGFGRIMTKTSLDMALKHMEIKRDRINSRNLGIVPGRSSTRE